jgi:hypothetical protein
LLGIGAALRAGAGDDIVQDQASRAEALLRRAEAVADRSLDAGFRAAAARSLAALSPEELDRRQREDPWSGLGPLSLGDPASHSCTRR